MDPQEQLASALRAVEKMAGKGFVSPGSEIAFSGEYLSTGWWGLDYGILTNGGFPMGRLVLLYGPEQSGKTLICLRAVAEAQRRGYLCTWFDVENCLFDPAGREWAERQGVGCDALLGSTGVIAEHILQAACELAATGAVRVIVIDSVAAMVPAVQQEEQEKLFGQRGRVGGDLAMVFSQGLKQLVEIAHRNAVLVLLTNQVRDAIGEHFVEERIPGGRAQLFHASQILRVEKKRDLLEAGPGSPVIGNEAAVSLRKSKVSPRGKRTGVDTPGHLLVYYDGRTVDEFETFLHFAKRTDLVQVSGAWLEWKGIRGQGQAKFKEALIEAEKMEQFRDHVSEKSLSLLADAKGVES